jgi:hypothetical protein
MDCAERMEILVVVDEWISNQEKISIETYLSMDELSEYYNHFDFDKFYNPMTDAHILRRYAGFRLKDAYTNINILAFNGINTTDALRQIASDMTNFVAVPVKLEKKLGPSYGNTIDAAWRHGSLIGTHYHDIMDANKAAVGLIQFTTGLADPFDIPKQTSEDIYRRLECVAVAALTPKK